MQRPAVDLDVVAVTAVDHVGAGSAEQHVVTGAAGDGVVARATDQHVVAGPTVQCELRRAGRDCRGIDDVVTGQRVDGHPVIAGPAPVTAIARGNPEISASPF